MHYKHPSQQWQSIDLIYLMVKFISIHMQCLLACLHALGWSGACKLLDIATPGPDYIIETIEIRFNLATKACFIRSFNCMIMSLL